jgi:hypothetical protein
MSRDDGGPAFPGTAENYKYEGCAGMSIRDYFAAKAMQGWTSNPLPNESSIQEVAEWAYRQADAMLAARSA